jgi:hypothetical protein
MQLPNEKIKLESILIVPNLSEDARSITIK